MLHRVAAFSTDYIRGLIIEALKPQGQMDFPEKHRNYGDGELNMSNVQKVEVLKALCSNFPFEEHLTLLKITVYSPLNPFSIVAWIKVEEEKGKVRERINIFHWVGVFLL